MPSLFAAYGAVPAGVAETMARSLRYRDPCWATYEAGFGVIGAGAGSLQAAERMFSLAGPGRIVVDAPTWITDGTPWAPSVAGLLDRFGELRGDAHCIAAFPDGSVVAYRGLMCARPLFFTVFTVTGASAGPMLLVASRPSAITAVDPREVDPYGLAPYLVPQLCDPSGSPWRGVQRIPPGHALIWRDGTATVRQVATFTTTDVKSAQPPDLVEEFRARLRTALTRSSGAVNALLLSGGIDSSALAATYTTLPAVRNTTGTAVRAFGLTYQAPLGPCDERRYAYDAAERTGLEFDALPANELLPLGCSYPIGDEPDPWPYAGRNWALVQHISDKLRHERDVPVTIIAGEGGDELLLGQVFSVADRIARGDPDAYAEVSTFPDPKSAAAVIDHLLTGAYDSRQTRMRRAIADLPPWFTRTWSEDVGLLDRVADSYIELGPAGSITPRYSQALVTEAGAAGRAQCGGWWTDMGLRAGVTIAYPFYDPDLAALIWALPPELIRSGGYEKAVLRQALDGELPDSVKHRRDKAEALALLHAGLTSHPDILYAIANDSPLVELGIIDARRLTTSIDRYLNGHRQLAPALWELVATHQWLTAESTRQPQLGQTP